MREIQRLAENGDRRARLALDIYAHRLIREAGAMIAVLGGLDALVFTGGVGENSSALRQALCASLGFLNLCLDPQANSHAIPDCNVAEPGSSIPVLVIAANEEWEIARESYRVLAA